MHNQVQTVESVSNERITTEGCENKNEVRGVLSLVCSAAQQTGPYVKFRKYFEMRQCPKIRCQYFTWKYMRFFKKFSGGHFLFNRKTQPIVFFLFWF